MSLFNDESFFFSRRRLLDVSHGRGSQDRVHQPWKLQLPWFRRKQGTLYWTGHRSLSQVRSICLQLSSWNRNIADSQTGILVCRPFKQCPKVEQCGFWVTIFRLLGFQIPITKLDHFLLHFVEIVKWSRIAPKTKIIRTFKVWVLTLFYCKL